MRVILAAALLTAAPFVNAESLYVIERLVVGVSDAPGDTGTRIATLRSGDRVEMLEQFEDESRVRVDGGTEGWVKTAYLSADMPLRLQLAERTRDLESAKAELTAVERELAAVRATPMEAEPIADAPQPTAAALVQTERPLFPSRTSAEIRPTWPWVALACSLALAAGFAIGWRVLDRRIRRKYGGLRIY